MKTVSEESAPAAELETPHSLEEAMETGFLPDDPHYRLTGEFKKPASEKTEASAASTASAESQKEEADKNEPEKDESAKTGDASAASAPSKAAASGTAPAQKEGRENQGKESRWQKRERELKDARAEVARLKAAQTSEQPRRESPQAVTQPADEAKAAPKPKIDDVDATGKPKYKSFAEYEDAKDRWLLEEGARQAQEAQSKSARQQAEQRQFEETKKLVTDKFAAARARYADFDKVALGEHLVIPKGSVTELFILDSDHGGEVAYYLGQHPEITGGFYADHDPKTGKFTSLITPQRQFRKLMEIEAQFFDGGKNGDGKSSSFSSAKPITQASRPPHQVSGSGTVAKDAVDQAVDDGDFETYQRAQNARELARLKKK
jgi:hypothetical protein